MEYVLKTEKLTKIYKNITVVNEVSLTVEQGDIYGFVGKNGAGKTTFMRMIMGLTKMNSGKFELLPKYSPSAARRKTGSLIESPALYTNMTASENIGMICTMLGESKKCVPEILKMIGLENTGRKKAADFSLGMKQRLGIGMALVGDPEFLMLDEPINGLDPTGIVEIRELILNLKNQGKTIFISSHILGELEKIANRYGIIANGVLREELTSEQLAERCGSRTIIKTDHPEKSMEILKKFFSAENIILDKDNSVVVTEKIKNIGEITNELFQNQIIVSGISDSESNAESYFIKMMEGE